MKHLLTILVSFFTGLVLAQFTENFNDNDIKNTPTWKGDDSVFVLIGSNGEFKLRSNKNLASNFFYLVTPSKSLKNTQWEIDVQLAFNTSSSNYVDIYLSSDKDSLLATDLNGYYVRIGGSTDEISLYKSVNGKATELIDGLDKVTNFSSNNLKIKVVCSPNYEWTLERDVTATGNDFIQEGKTIIDSSVVTSNYFGLKIRQSTASFFQKHFFDNIYVGAIKYDTIPPLITTFSVIDSLQLDVSFSEKIDSLSALPLSNYKLQSGNSVIKAFRDSIDYRKIHLFFSNSLKNGVNQQLTLSNLTDLKRNSINTQTINFTYLIPEIPLKGDVIISEFLADPTTGVGLPEIEFIEIYNKSNKVFNLKNWIITDNSSNGTIGDTWLLPNSYKVLCTTSAIDSFTNSVAVTTFPSLNNAGDVLILKDDRGTLIDQIQYKDSWFTNSSKKEGGYSLELINPNHPCSSPANWSESISLKGGTPGIVNSVFDLTPYIKAPSISDVFVLDSNTLVVKFTELLDSALLSSLSLVTSPSLIISKRNVNSQFYDSLFLTFNSVLKPSTNYTITLGNIIDCWGNDTLLTTSFVYAEKPVVGDLVLNEILFDPYVGGVDFIEIRNNSLKFIDLSELQLANYDEGISNVKTVVKHKVIPPNEFLVCTSDPNYIFTTYKSTRKENLFQLDLPSYNNDSGTVYLMNQGTILDKLSYNEDWHFTLLNSTEGISLERLSPLAETNTKNNWHSAAENIGFATPGLENSQILYGDHFGTVSLTNPTFSPDNDGFEDVLQINYSFSDPGFLVNCKIFDERGRLVQVLTKNQLVGNNGFYTWDGINEENLKASIGTYVLLFEATNQNGERFVKKLAFVLASKI